jgi:hypothetical protein
LSTPILDVSRKPAKFKEIHSLDWSQGIFSRLTFGDVAGSPLLIGEQARKIFKQGFSQPLSNEDPRKLESTMLRLIGTTLPRFHDAWLLKSAAQTLSKGLEPEQVFPPAVKVLSMFKESEKLKELERTPAPERQKIIDELSASIPATKAKITGHQPLSDDSKSQGR